MESGSGMQILAQLEMQQFAVSRLERRGGESWEGICINPRNIYAKCKMEYASIQETYPSQRTEETTAFLL